MTNAQHDKCTRGCACVCSTHLGTLLDRIWGSLRLLPRLTSGTSRRPTCLNTTQYYRPSSLGYALVPRPASRHMSSRDVLSLRKRRLQVSVDLPLHHRERRQLSSDLGESEVALALAIDSHTEGTHPHERRIDIPRRLEVVRHPKC